MKIDPGTVVLLAVAGGAAWWLLNRKAAAAPASVRGGALLPAGAAATMYQAPRPQTDPLDPFLNALGRKIGGWLGTSGSQSAPAVVGPDLAAVNPGPDPWPTDAYGQGLF